jgi:hypothetical protein
MSVVAQLHWLRFRPYMGVCISSSNQELLKKNIDSLVIQLFMHCALRSAVNSFWLYWFVPCHQHGVAAMCRAWRCICSASVTDTRLTRAALN